MEEVLLRLKFLEEKVIFLESRLELELLNTKKKTTFYDFEESLKNIIVEDFHLSQVLETNIEDQIISIIVDHNQQNTFLQIRKGLYKFQGEWIVMTDSDYKFMFETIEYKIIKLYSKTNQNADKYFENNKKVYGLNLSARFKKLKIKLIDNISL
uniref:Uncharacterized protein n=1 Tax=viral metagenome TaxID=1070528 RepID=A0A6C0ESJ5_9ZZZZ